MAALAVAAWALGIAPLAASADPAEVESTVAQATSGAKATPPTKATPVRDTRTPAKQLFGYKTTPANFAPQALGFYSRGCLAGGVALPVTGKTWQVMRLSRKRNWGHPDLVRYLEDLSVKVRAAGWRGLLVGDMAQARGGPMLTGHASHQVGLDADIWLTQMPARVLTAKERESMSAVNMVRRDRRDVDPNAWTRAHTEVMRIAASDPRIERIFVNPAIKKALCREAGEDRGWLRVVRPWYGHDYHFHVRMRCPSGSTACEPQDPTPPGDGCGADLDYWFTPAVMSPPPPKVPAKPTPPLTLADLPTACTAVIAAP